MKKFTRPALVLALASGLVLSGTAAAQATTPAAAPTVAAAVPTNLGPVCEAAKSLHWTAEWVLEALGLQPIFSLIDKPIIHPILWSPLDRLTGGCGVDSHPSGLG